MKFIFAGGTQGLYWSGRGRCRGSTATQEGNPRADTMFRATIRFLCRPPFSLRYQGQEVRGYPLHGPRGQAHNDIISTAATGACHGPLARYVQFRVAHAPGMTGTFSPPPLPSDPDMNHGRCVTHVPWCMPGSLISGFLWSRWRGKRSRHSRRMRNPQFYAFGKRPMVSLDIQLTLRLVFLLSERATIPSVRFTIFIDETACLK